MSAWKGEWENAIIGKQLGSVQEETLAVSATGIIVDNQHNRPLILQERRHRLTEEEHRQEKSPGRRVFLERKVKTRAGITSMEVVRIRRVFIDILPYVKISDLNRDANSATHPAAKQLDERMPQQTPTPMPTPVTPTQIQRAHSFRTPTDVRAKQWRFQIVSLKIQANNRRRRRRKKKKKSALFPREPRPLLFAFQPKNAWLTWSSNRRTDASEFRMIQCS